MTTDVWYYWGEDWRMHTGRAPLPFISPPYRCGTLTHDNHEIVMKPRSCGMTGHREGCKCDPKGKVDND